jgi:hypothetical protein
MCVRVCVCVCVYTCVFALQCLLWVSALKETTCIHEVNERATQARCIAQKPHLLQLVGAIDDERELPFYGLKQRIEM